MAGYIIDENKNLLSDANAINNLYQNALDNPEDFYKNLSLFIQSFNNFLVAISVIMTKIIGDSEAYPNLNDSNTRLTIVSQWISTQLSMTSEISRIISFMEDCSEFYRVN